MNRKQHESKYRLGIDRPRREALRQIIWDLDTVIDWARDRLEVDGCLEGDQVRFPARDEAVIAGMVAYLDATSWPIGGHTEQQVDGDSVTVTGDFTRLYQRAGTGKTEPLTYQMLIEDGVRTRNKMSGYLTSVRAKIERAEVMLGVRRKA